MNINIDKIWYQKHPLRFLLLPLSWLYRLFVSLRRFAYQSGLLRTGHLSVPVIVVGNISVGGTGKTPFVIWLVEFLRQEGWKPGVISRGYGGKSAIWPQGVTAESEAEQIGDEPLLIARSAQVPVHVGPDRIAAAEQLLSTNDCDILISDDGLQHYALNRDVEICVIDGQRQHGNGHCIPAGPLREPTKRLNEVDIIISNGREMEKAFTMQLEGQNLLNLVSEVVISLNDMKGKTVHAVAGIGNPQRFFQTLREAGLNLIEHAFPDHAEFVEQDIQFDDGLPVIMTEKDAVKCKAFAHEQCYFLGVKANLPEGLHVRLRHLLERMR